MAGINLGGGVAWTKTTLALEILKSRSFIEGFIDRHDILVPLMAAKGWNKETDTIIIDDSIYDAESKGGWVILDSSEENKPTAWRYQASTSYRTSSNQRPV